MSYRFPVLLAICLASTLSLTALAQDEDVAPAAPTPPAAPAPVPTPAAPAPKPAGNPQKAKTEAPPPVAPIAAVNRDVPDCLTYLGTPLDGGMVERDSKLYFISPKLPSDQAGGSTYLIEADLIAGKAKRIAGFKGGDSASLIEHGRSLDAISILDFSAMRPDCGEGTASGTAIKWLDRKVLPSFGMGKYAFVIGEEAGHLADMDKGLVQDIDLVSKQKRTLNSFEAGARPLFIKTTPPVAIYTYNPKSRELSKYVNLKKVPELTLKLKEGMKLLQERDQFGIMQIKDNDHVVQISHIQGWSGKNFKTFDINLPNGILASKLSVQISFQSSQVLLFGKDEDARKSLRQVLYYKGKDLTKTFKAPDGMYFSSARFSKDHNGIFTVSDISSNVVRELWYLESENDVKKIDVLKEKKAVPAKTP
jgi:hypothetical protein